ncbi:MAG: OmpA family protein [Rhodobacteraceae bacterium]|nr:OmpA family protein [Paracoccaceae bacterium]
MGAQSNAAPVIIKRKKVVGGDGHHGGAWKVAYADFVTAMMAFFLLMWLLNATTEKQRKGLADYFSPDIPISRTSAGGDGAFGGISPFAEDTLTRMGTGATDRHPSVANQAQGRFGVALEGRETSPDKELASIEEALQGRGGESLVSTELSKHIVTRVTDEGLIIELFSTEDSRLFKPDSANPTDLFRRLIRMIGQVSNRVNNPIAITGHLRSRPVVLAQNPVWELSTARAGTTRELLESSGVSSARIRRLTGHADRNPTEDNPMSVRNNRVEITILRR